MKKSIALIITFVIILTCFVACKKEGQLEGGVLATNAKGQVVAAVVTQENGKLQRDEAGNNAVVLVTDANGNNVKENGEVVTKVEPIKNAIIVGDRIEMTDYAINIPDGWSDNYSVDTLNLIKDGTNDSFAISTLRNEKLADVEADNNEMLKFVDSENKVNTTVKVAGKDASFVSAFTTTADGTGVYLGFITFSHQGVVYRCMINSDRDISGDIDTIVAILDTIEFVH